MCYRRSYPGFKAHHFCTLFYCHLSSVWLYRIFSTLPCSGTISEKKRLLNTKCFDFSIHCPKHFSFYEKFSEMFPSSYIEFYIKYSLVLSILLTLIILAGFRKILKYRFSLESVHWDIPCEQKEGMMAVRHDKDFRKFGKAPKKGTI